MVKYFQLMGPEGIRLATYHRVEGKTKVTPKYPVKHQVLLWNKVQK